MAEQPYYSRGINSGPSERPLPDGRVSGTGERREGGSGGGVRAEGGGGAVADGERNAAALNVSLWFFVVTLLLLLLLLLSLLSLLCVDVDDILLSFFLFPFWRLVTVDNT